MIGRDFSKVGVERNIFQKIKNGTRETLVGPIKIYWLDSTNFAVVDSLKSVHFQSVYGHITTTIVANTKSALRVGNILLEDTQEEGGGKGGHRSDRQVLIDLDIVANDISLIPGTTKFAIADARKFISFVDTANWEIQDGFGKYQNPKKKQEDLSVQAHAIASFTVDEQIFICVVDSNMNNVKVISEDGMVALEIGAPGGVPGILPGHFDEPCSIAVCKPHRSHSDVDSEGYVLLESDPYTPSWFLPPGLLRKQIEDMLLTSPAYGGKFFVCPRASNPTPTSSSDTDSRRTGSNPTGPSPGPSAGVNTNTKANLNQLPPIGENTLTSAPVEEIEDPLNPRRGVQEGSRYGIPLKGFASEDPSGKTIPVNEYTEPMEITHRIIIAKPSPEAAAAKSKEYAEKAKQQQKESLRFSKKAKETATTVTDPFEEFDRKKQEKIMMMKDYQLATSDGTQVGRSYASIWELIKADADLENKSDRRPFVWMAVGERSNKRVQIFRYFWMSSEVYRPTCEHTYTVGGIFDLFVPIRFPTSIDFSTSGELAICDTGLKKIYLLTPYMTLIKAFQVPFRYTEVVKSQKHSAAIQSSSFLQPLGSSDNDDDHEDDDNNSQNDPTTRSAKAPRTITTIDDKPVSVAFAPDGKLAVGYDQGGVCIYPVCKLASVGDFHVLTIPAMKNIMSYTCYEEAKALRGCCKFFHDYTRSLRFHWDIHPLRRRAGDWCVALFMKYSRSLNNELDMEVTRRKELSDFRDFASNPLCPRYLRMKPCSGGGKKGKCVQGLSHGQISMDYYIYNNSNFFMEKRTFLLAASELFDHKFIWLHELYLDKLFAAYSSDEYLQHRADVKPRIKCGALQLKTVPFRQTCRVIDFAGFLEVMTVLEEHHTGANHIDTHPLFNPVLIAKNKILQGDPNLALSNSLADVKLSVYSDPLLQYSKPLSVPPIKPKKRQQKFHGQEIAEKKYVDPGPATTHSTVDRQIHMATFWQYAENSTALIQKLFKTEQQRRMDKG